MKYSVVYLCGTVIIVLLACNGIQAQDTTAALNADTLRNAPDSSQVQTQKEKQLEKFQKAFNAVKAQEKEEKKQGSTQDKISKDPVLNLEGFVLDETRSRFGHMFYKFFYRDWEAPENAPYYTIKISENPIPGLGTQITIKMNYEELLNFRLQPKYEFIKKISKQAAAYVQKKLKETSVKDKLLY